MTPTTQSFIDLHNNYIANVAFVAHQRSAALFAATGPEAVRAYHAVGATPPECAMGRACFCVVTPHAELGRLIRGAGVTCVRDLDETIARAQALATAEGNVVLAMVIATAEGLEASVLVINPMLSAGDA